MRGRLDHPAGIRASGKIVKGCADDDSRNASERYRRGCRRGYRRGRGRDLRGNSFRRAFGSHLPFELSRAEQLCSREIFPPPFLCPFATQKNGKKSRSTSYPRFAVR